MTDEQVIRHYAWQERGQANRLERYHSDSAYREKRRQQNVEAKRRHRERLRQMRHG